MKYGYLYYRKHMLENKKERPMNLGDPIQSFAVIEVYRRLGIPTEELIPIDRFDLATYDGEDVILIINGIESYEHYAYHTRFLPVSSKIHPVIVSISLRRDFAEEELLTFRNNQPVGCRDEYTVNFLRSNGIDAYLSGCLTMVFPKRETSDTQNKVFIIDCPRSILEYIPEDINRNAITLSQIIRIKSKSTDSRLTDEETEKFTMLAKQRLEQLRDEAKLVITGRLHVATPCAAMGIPVILTKDSFNHRFQAIDRFLPLYTPDRYGQIDWHNISTKIPENVKNRLVSVCGNMIRLTEDRLALKEIYSKKIQEVQFMDNEAIAISNLDVCNQKDFKYAIWGVCLPSSYILYETMNRIYPNAHLECAIDTWARGTYKDDVMIISPNDIDNILDKNVWIIVIASAAHKAAQECLEGKYNYILVSGAKAEVYPIK